MSGEFWVSVGKGSIVLVLSVNWDATALGGRLVVAAEAKLHSEMWNRKMDKSDSDEDLILCWEEEKDRPGRHLSIYIHPILDVTAFVPFVVYLHCHSFAFTSKHSMRCS